METDDVVAWFDGYLEAFGAYARGDTDDPQILLGFYNLPLLLTSDDGVLSLTTQDALSEVVARQVGGLRSAGYDHSDVLTSEIVALNEWSLLYRTDVSRRHADGTEIQRLQLTDLVVETPVGPRIAVIAIHTP